MLRLPNNHKLTLIKRETGLFENVVMREFPPTGKLSPGGGGEPALLLASSHPEEGRNEQVSVLFLSFTIFFFKAGYCICFHLAEWMMQEYG